MSTTKIAAKPKAAPKPARSTRAKAPGKAPAKAPKAKGKAGKPSKPNKAPKAPKLPKAAVAAHNQREVHDAAAPVAKTPKLPAFTASLRKQVIAALDELKARDVKEIDIREKASYTDLLVIASGTSTRHVKSIADEVVKFSKRAGVMPLGVEGQQEAEWVLVDLGDIVVHVMLPRIREFYGLERLWTVGDEPPLEEAAAAF